MAPLDKQISLIVTAYVAPSTSQKAHRSGNLWPCACGMGNKNAMNRKMKRGTKQVVVQVDQAGRIILPKAMRERLRLQAGDSLTVQVKGEAIELRPLRPNIRLKRAKGVLVLTSPLPLREDMVSESRSERIDRIASESE
jgi:AbrB family looped-hinge helix DNA binding protein